VGFVAILIANGSSQARWQAKVEADVPGRVFAILRVLAQIAGPRAMIVAGPLADNVFGPLLEEDGSLTGSLGPILGAGPGRGIGLFFVVLGPMSIGFTIIAIRILGCGISRMRSLMSKHQK